MTPSLARHGSRFRTSRSSIAWVAPIAVLIAADLPGQFRFRPPPKPQGGAEKAVVERPLVLRDVTIVDEVRRQEAVHVVVVRGAKIVEVAPRLEFRRVLEMHENARVIDGRGKFLIPGLWDMHVHATSSPKFSELYIAHGVTGVRDMFSDARLHRLKAAIREKKRVGPRIVCGPIVDGAKPVWPGSRTASNADEGRAVVAKLVEEKADFVKVYARLDRATYLAIADEAKRRKIPFDGHVPNSMFADECAAAGQRSIEHLTGMFRATSKVVRERFRAGTDLPRDAVARTKLLLESYDEEQADELFATFVRHGTWHCPTLTVLRSTSRLDDPELTKDPRMKLIPSFWKAFWNPKRDFRFQKRDAEFWPWARKLYARQVALVGVMHRKGVRLLAGTDAANPFCFPGLGLHEELALLVGAGLTPREALRTATLHPAIFLGREEEFGTVETGKWADLVLLDADPRKQIEHTRKIRGVVAHGRWFDRAALDALRGG